MVEMHLRQPRFMDSDFGSFTENEETKKKIKRNRTFKIYLSKRSR